MTNEAAPTVAQGEYDGLIARLTARVRIARMWGDGQIADDTLEEFAANLAGVEGAAADALAALQAKVGGISEPCQINGCKLPFLDGMVQRCDDLERDLASAQARIAELEAFVRRVGDGYHAAKDAPQILDEFTAEARALVKGEK